MALTAPASLARKTGATILDTLLESDLEEAARAQSRIRCTTQRCHAAPWKTSSMIVPSANLGIAPATAAAVACSAMFSIGSSSLPRIRYVAISDSRTMASSPSKQPIRSDPYTNNSDAISLDAVTSLLP